MTEPRDDLADDIDAIARDIPHETSGFAELRSLLGLLAPPLAPLLPGGQLVELGDPAASVGAGSLQTPVSDVLTGEAPGTQPGTDQAINSQALTDFFQDAVTAPKGVQGSWLKLLANRLYNGDFASGTFNRIAATEAAGGATTANYLKSLGTDLPYWVVAVADGILKRVADATAAGGIALKMTFDAANQTIYFYQDVPVVPGRNYLLTYGWRYNADFDNFGLTTYLGFRDSTHAQINRFNIGIAYGPGSVAAYADYKQLAVGVAPANASFLRVEILVNANTIPAPTAALEIYFNSFQVTDIVDGLKPVVNVYVAGSVWAKPDGLSHIVVECQGGGGGGGGGQLTAAAQGAVGGCGGGGGYAAKLILASALSGNYTVVVGGGGGGGAAGANPGVAGGLSSFAGAGITTVQGNGGALGPAAAAAASGVVAGGAGGAASGGDLNIPGGAGSNGCWAAGVPVPSGHGGDTARGSGGRQPASIVVTTAGLVGGAYGGGGSGGVNGPAQAAGVAGGNGAAGVVVVTEYYNGP